MKMKTRLLIIACCAFVLGSCEKQKIKAPSTVSSAEASLDCFNSAQSLLRADLACDLAKSELAKQLTPGGASLRTIEFQAALDRMKSQRAEYKAKLELLEKSEIAEKSEVWKSVIIDRYLDSARGRTVMWRSKDDPDYIRVQNLTLDEIVAKGGEDALGPLNLRLNLREE
jgi:hypothetical protein